MFRTFVLLPVMTSKGAGRLSRQLHLSHDLVFYPITRRFARPSRSLLPRGPCAIWLTESRVEHRLQYGAKNGNYSRSMALSARSPSLENGECHKVRLSYLTMRFRLSRSIWTYPQCHRSNSQHGVLGLLRKERYDGDWHGRACTGRSNSMATRRHHADVYLPMHLEQATSVV